MEVIGELVGALMIQMNGVEKQPAIRWERRKKFHARQAGDGFADGAVCRAAVLERILVVIRVVIGRRHEVYQACSGSELLEQAPEAHGLERIDSQRLMHAGGIAGEHARIVGRLGLPAFAPQAGNRLFERGQRAGIAHRKPVVGFDHGRAGAEAGEPAANHGGLPEALARAGEEIAQFITEQNRAEGDVRRVIGIVPEAARMGSQKDEIAGIQHRLEHRQVVEQIVEVRAQTEHLRGVHQDHGSSMEALFPRRGENAPEEVNMSAGDAQVQGDSRRRLGVEAIGVKIFGGGGVAEHHDGSVAMHPALRQGQDHGKRGAMVGQEIPEAAEVKEDRAGGHQDRQNRIPGELRRAGTRGLREHALSVTNGLRRGFSF